MKTTGVSSPLYALSLANWFKLGAFETAPTSVPKTHAPASPMPTSSSASWGLGTIPAIRTPAASPPRIPLIQRAQSPVSRPYSSQSSGPKSPQLDSSWDAADTWDTPAQAKPSAGPAPSNNVALGKEEKAAEMARRKEERKQVGQCWRDKTLFNNQSSSELRCSRNRRRLEESLEGVFATSGHVLQLYPSILRALHMCSPIS